VRLERYGRNGDPRAFDPLLRPLPAIFPYSPQDLRAFDGRVEFITTPPGGLIKPTGVFESLSDEERLPFKVANQRRIDDIVRKNGPRTLFIFTDGARREGDSGRRESCAGAFAVCTTATPRKGVPGDVLHCGRLSANPIACIYTAELLAIFEALQWVKANRARPGVTECDRIVLITDSKSALESMKTTWLRRIANLEQRACRVLFELATGAQPFHVTLAFVFSHTGGCPGNDLADKLATRALNDVGLRWRDDELWDVDTTRRMQRNLNAEVHAKMCGAAPTSFRVRTLSGNGANPERLAPSERLPASLTRAQEILLYRARVGTMPDVGGFLPRLPDPCPLCAVAATAAGQQPPPAELGRNGAAIEHLLQCPASGVSAMGASEMWRDPTKAVKRLELIYNGAMATGRCAVQQAR
jgi:ribonuclease HI